MKNGIKVSQFLGNFLEEFHDFSIFLILSCEHLHQGIGPEWSDNSKECHN